MEPWFPWRAVNLRDPDASDVLEKVVFNCSFTHPERIPVPNYHPNSGILPWEWDRCIGNRVCFRDRMRLVLEHESL